MVYEYRYPELVNTQPGESRKTVLELSMKMEFMLVQKVYEETLEIIRHAALNNEERVAAFYHFNLHWCEFSGKDFSRYFEEVGSFRWCGGTSGRAGLTRSGKKCWSGSAKTGKSWRASRRFIRP